MFKIKVSAHIHNSNPMRTWVCQPTAKLTFTSPQIEAYAHRASLGVAHDQHVEYSSRYCFLDQDYRYTSVATQILQYAVSASSVQPGSRFLLHRGSNQLRIL